MRELDHCMCFGEALPHFITENRDLAIDLSVDADDCFRQESDLVFEALRREIKVPPHLSGDSLRVSPRFGGNSLRVAPRLLVRCGVLPSHLLEESSQIIIHR